MEATELDANRLRLGIHPTITVAFKKMIPILINESLKMKENPAFEIAKTINNKDLRKESLENIFYAYLNLHDSIMRNTFQFLKYHLNVPNKEFSDIFNEFSAHPAMRGFVKSIEAAACNENNPQTEAILKMVRHAKGNNRTCRKTYTNCSPWNLNVSDSNADEEKGNQIIKLMDSLKPHHNKAFELAITIKDPEERKKALSPLFESFLKLHEEIITKACQVLICYLQNHTEREILTNKFKSAQNFMDAILTVKLNS